MVRFALSAKGSSSAPRRSDAFAPPPYNEDDHDSSLILGGTTTTTTQVITTTTQTTTHFFSLPLWRRRPSPSPHTRRSMSGAVVDETGSFVPLPASHSLPAIDKDLPPTPTSSSEDLSPSVMPGDRSVDYGSHGEPPLHPPPAQSPHRPALSGTSSQSALALAHAALGLGLPHVMPHASASSSSSDLNTVPFMSVPERADRFSLANVRRVKSFQKLTSQLSLDDPSSGGQARARGVSLETNPQRVYEDLQLKRSKEESQIPAHVTPPRKSLARRASFWTRKRNDRNDSLTKLPTPPPEVERVGLQPSLPALPPISPFRFDTSMTSSSSLPQIESRTVPSPPGLTRRNSERQPHLSSSPSRETQSSFMLQSSTPRRHRRRPSTADATVERSSIQPLFVNVEASNMPPPPPISLPPPSISEPQLPTRPPARPRSQTNPPLLHRLSMNLFSLSSSSTAPSPNTSTVLGDNTLSQSPVASPRNSTSKSHVQVPKPKEGEESPELYLSRLIDAVSKAEIASALASSGDEFHARALQAYINRFDFTGDPLDVALRKLLMDVGLPRETQQIDRVMEAFAARYREGNPHLFVSDDHPYILAFSLIMLHTDAFNKSNKRKMTKADYVKNTRLPGVPPEVLDCYYDNIVFAPFIFIEDPLDVNGQRGFLPETNSRLLPGGITSQHSLPGNGSSVTLLGRSNKVDPYYLITKNLLRPLRVDVEQYVPLDNPYSAQGSGSAWDEAELRRAFAKAGVIEVGAADRRPSSVFAMNVGGFPAPYTEAHEGLHSPSTDVSALKVTKVGLLNRKDVTLEGGKRATTKKWKEWSVILTGSQLLLFRDSIWATNLLEQATSTGGQPLFPPISLLKPDELLSVNDAIAVFDRSYEKHDHTFRFVMSDGRHFLLQASERREAQEWVARINYASTFKTAGVRMRPLGISGKDVELMGVAAAASHLREMQANHTESPSSARVRSWGSNNSDDFLDRLSTSPAPSYGVSKFRKAKTVSGRGDMDLEVPTAPNIEGAQQFKATFDQVKADLAAGRWASVDDVALKSSDGRQRAHSLESTTRPLVSSPTEDGARSRVSSRTQLVRSKIRDLESRITTTQSQLDSDLRLVRNIAVLTPFQRATRVRLEAVVQGVAGRIKQSRLQLAKLLCHRDVLSRDLMAEERDWNRTKSIALKAATETLHSRRDPSIPRMTLSLHIDDPEPLASSPANTSGLNTPSHRPASSSASESFHSALDFDWSMSTTPEDVFDIPRVDSPSGTTVPDESFRTPSTPFSPGLQNTTPSSAPSSSSLSLSSPMFNRSNRSTTVSTVGTATPEREATHERYTTALEGPDEEAEEWNKTRAAKRVSLVRMPTDLKMSKAFARQDSLGSLWSMQSPVFPPPRF
ncbi:hypothetical protein BV25DRAFT_1846549 [Artomyces pyxidatus]|uniref:Uncharacterized protein n=1 Tax=Artomyces pyxidatus TaxID=48021 RepID=A0ACB8TJ44_9AGAM|nr:hypothetical protein BV25DRAFT_1846549 [Artomyces pyxidatus]